MAKKKMIEFIGVGRRKTAVASVRLRPEGSGRINVNGKNMEEYFTSSLQRNEIFAPFNNLPVETSQYDFIIRIKGGGMSGQADAVRLGIARALVKELEDRRQDLKSEGFLRRDPRRKERKKYGLRGARRAFQFSKR